MSQPPHPPLPPGRRTLRAPPYKPNQTPVVSALLRAAPYLRASPAVAAAAPLGRLGCPLPGQALRGTYCERTTHVPSPSRSPSLQQKAQRSPPRAHALSAPRLDPLDSPSLIHPFCFLSLSPAPPVPQSSTTPPVPLVSGPPPRSGPGYPLSHPLCTGRLHAARGAHPTHPLSVMHATLDVIRGPPPHPRARTAYPRLPARPGASPHLCTLTTPHTVAHPTLDRTALV